MKSFFNPDSAPTRFLSAFTDLIIVNLCWLITSLPILTLGAASTAMYYAITKCVRHDANSILRAYLHSLKQNIWQGILLTVLTFGYTAVVGLSLYFALYFEGSDLVAVIWIASCCMLLLPVLFVLPFLFPLLSRFTLRTIDCLKLAFSCGVRYLWRTLVFWLAFALAVFCVFLTPLAFLLAPALACFAGTFLIEPVLGKLQSCKTLPSAAHDDGLCQSDRAAQGATEEP